jgi:hypothetical protein
VGHDHRGRRCRRSRATFVMSAPWPSRRTARCWRRHRTTRRSGCGTRPRGRRCRRSSALSLLESYLSLEMVNTTKLIAGCYIPSSTRLMHLLRRNLSTLYLQMWIGSLKTEKTSFGFLLMVSGSHMVIPEDHVILTPTRRSTTRAHVINRLASALLAFFAADRETQRRASFP